MMKLRVYLKDVNAEASTKSYAHCNFFAGAEVEPNFEKNYELWVFDNVDDLNTDAIVALNSDSNVSRYVIEIDEVNIKYDTIWNALVNQTVSERQFQEDEKSYEIKHQIIIADDLDAINTEYYYDVVNDIIVDENFDKIYFERISDSNTDDSCIIWVEVKTALFFHDSTSWDDIEISNNDVFLNGNDVYSAIEFYKAAKKCDLSEYNSLQQAMTFDEFKKIKKYYPISKIAIRDLQDGMSVYIKSDNEAYWAGEIVRKKI